MQSVLQAAQAQATSYTRSVITGNHLYSYTSWPSTDNHLCTQQITIHKHGQPLIEAGQAQVIKQWQPLLQAVQAQVTSYTGSPQTRRCRRPFTEWMDMNSYVYIYIDRANLEGSSTTKSYNRYELTCIYIYIDRAKLELALN